MSGVAQAPRARLLVPVGAWAARFRPRVPPVAVAYGLPSLMAALAAQTWFRNDTVLASGDLTPPVVPGTNYLSHWNQFESGAGVPSFQIVWLPYFEGLRLFNLLGFDPSVFQRVWLTLLLAAATAAVVFLARGVVSSPLAVAVAAVLATLNAYRLTTTFDSLPLMAMIAAAVLGGLVIRAGSESRPRPLVFALASLLCAFVFLNPPHLALVLAWVMVSAVLSVAVHGWSAPIRVLRFLVVAVPLAILFNLWWVVPATLGITSPTFETRFAAAGIGDWAWTHVRADLTNVVGLTSSWAWGRPAYFPFSIRLEAFPLSALQYVPAAAAVLGFVLAWRSRYRPVAAVLFVVGVAAIWVMKGLHEPVGTTNLWLYEHIPGFWLLREPAKVGLVLVLVYALLGALAVERLETVSRSLARTVAAVAVVGAAAYAHPFFTGSVVPSDRPLLPSAQVRFPNQWEAVARYLDADRSAGKVVVLPRLDYYQAPATWGYYGATFVHQLISRPVIDAPLPGGYYRDPVVPQLITQLERRVLSGRGATRTILGALGAKYILVRRDLATDFPERSFTAPGLLARRLRQRRDVRLVRSFGVADLYAAANGRNPEVYPAVPLLAAPGASVPALHAAVDIGAEAVIAPRSSRRLLDGIRMGQIGVVPASGPVAAELAAARAPRTVGRRGGASGRGTRSPEAGPSRSLRLLAGSESFAVEAPLTTVRAALNVPAAESLRHRFLAPEAVPFTRLLASGVGDCYRYDERSLHRVGIAARVVGPHGGGTLRLTARDHAACVAIWLSGSRPPPALRLRLRYRTVRGNPARLCVWQEGPDRCALSPALKADRRWHLLDTTLRIAARTRVLAIFLYADGGGIGRTITEYRGLTFARGLRTTGVAVAPVVQLPDVTYRRVSPSKFRVRVRHAGGPFLLVAAETFAPGWRVEAPGRKPRRVTHVRVNGYANGWRIPWRGSYDLTIAYGPERVARIARRLDLVVVPLGFLALLWPRRLWPIPNRRRRRGASR